MDDDQDIRDTLTELLTDEGYSVLNASNGEEALATLRTKERPDLILLDLMMPVMDGWQFRAAQQNEPGVADIPVVVVSATPKDDKVQKLGAAQLLKKPIRLEELLDAVSRHIC
ncbi:response regulator [Chondromyces apiculatus]|uniref:Response regulator receiver domain protein (CheY-like) n=1 Tax=Chondromyces apiculatus DSM 436 TaxID=1192034 RepID=A0A017SZM4_9BACT|nr:response regulator [Chondromyces apiculatus]EYF01761.1 response regulator receiver domain protein (CheY-like) [Chondromyces apiculatus DSM 436]